MDVTLNEFFPISLPFPLESNKVGEIEDRRFSHGPTVVIQRTGPPFMLINTTGTLAIATLALKIWILVAVVDITKRAPNTPLHNTMKNNLRSGDLIH